MFTVQFFIYIQIDLMEYFIYKPYKMFISDFQSVQDLPPQERDLTYYLLQIKYMRSKIRTRSSKGVEKRGVADMPRSGEPLRFVD